LAFYSLKESVIRHIVNTDLCHFLAVLKGHKEEFRDRLRVRYRHFKIEAPGGNFGGDLHFESLPVYVSSKDITEFV